MFIKNDCKSKIIVPMILTIILTICVFTGVLYKQIDNSLQSNGLMLMETLRISMENTIISRKTVEDVMEKEMVGEATLLALLVDKGISQPELVDLAKRAGIDEFWITDQTGKVVLNNLDSHLDFSFGSDTKSQAYEFMDLIGGKKLQVSQPAQKRTIDQKVFKYVGVTGWGSPRIIQTGREGQALTDLDQKVGSKVLIESLKGNLGKDILYSAMVAADGRVLISSDENSKELPEKLRGNLKNNNEITFQRDFFQDKQVTYYFSGLSNGSFLVVALSNEILVSIRNSALLTGMLAIMIASMIAFYIVGRIIRRIQVLDEMAGNVAAGNLDVICHVDADDEIGSMTKSFEKIILALRALTRDTEMLTKASIEGQLTIRADVTKHQGEYGKVVAGINNTLDAVVAPIEEVTSVLKKMSDGNLHERVVGNYKGDHAHLKMVLNKTLGDISAYITEITKVLEQMSKGNFDLEINNGYKGDFSKIKDALNLIIVSFNQVFSGINCAADQVSIGARQVSDGSQASAQGATEQASSIEELTVTISQVAMQTRENALRANKANELALKASGHAEDGNQCMAKMLASMAKINDSSGKISKIIKVIDEIAFQTNILSLNAAVEAARAGQHGKGFSVVAEEVRNLAVRSANAAKETTELIEGSVENVEYGMRMAHGTATVLQEIGQGVAEVVEFVKEIAGASNEQATAIGQVNQGIEQVAMVIQTNSATSEESAAASEELSGQADMMRDMIGKFKLKS